jgi:hypothetical protein
MMDGSEPQPSGEVNKNEIDSEQAIQRNQMSSYHQIVGNEQNEVQQKTTF